MAYPLATLGPTISASGISIPPYNDVYQSLLAIYKGIYGSDIYLAADSQDGQWIAAMAKAIDDSNQAMVSVFNAFSPTYAQGTQLSSVVKINGLSRNISSKSTAVGNVVGVAGTIITAGVVADGNGNLWNLPASVTIPVGGSISVTATAQSVGNIAAAAGTINKLSNPQLGWQSFVSTADAVPGAAVETDPQLRARQSLSTALSAQTIKEAIYAAIGNTAGVQRFTVYENDTTTTDANGVPAHALSAIVAGGTVVDIATAIASKKAPGVPTYGTTSYTVYDANGLPNPINFFVLQNVQVYFSVTIKALTGYVSTTGTELIAALVNFVNSLAIGDDVYYGQARAISSLMGVAVGQTFTVTDFRLGLSSSPTGTADLVIAFNQAAACATGNVTLVVN